MIILRLNENNFHDFQYSNYNSSTLLHDKIVKKRKNKTSLAKLLSSDERERNSFEGSINASVSFFLSRRIVETWNKNLITKKGKNGETRVNHNACLILSSLPFLPFLEKWLFRTTVSDNGADNGLTSINQVQPGVIGRECKKRSREYENVNQDGGPSSVGRKEPTRVGQLGKRHRNGCSK